MIEASTLEEAREVCGVQTAALSDGTTAYTVEGEQGPWVVLVHGLLTPSFAWEPLSSTLAAAGFRVLRYDQLGRGLSDRPHVPYTPELYVRQLRELVDWVGIEAMHMVAWSMGGIVASRFAVESPDRVLSSALIAPAFYVGQPPIVRSLIHFERGRGLLGRNVARAVGRLQRQHLVYPERYPAYLERTSEQLQFPGVGWSFVSTLEHFAWNCGPDLAALRHHPRPVLIVWGTRDRTTPYRNAKKVRALLPKAEWLVIERARHGVHLDHRDEVESAIVTHLRRAEAGRPRQVAE